MIKSVIKRNVIRLLVKARENKKIRALLLARWRRPQLKKANWMIEWVIMR
ncbi:hypothetical protein M9Y45_21160 [Enterobacter hormaechei subsp. xiangfangensis]|nr:hypothetical protein [Enterobacter hormaechei]MCL8356374.1 hypothetical protein [Enterobacter hormaechei subsp. xiangfangensis]